MNTNTNADEIFNEFLNLGEIPNIIKKVCDVEIKKNDLTKYALYIIERNKNRYNSIYTIKNANILSYGEPDENFINNFSKFEKEFKPTKEVLTATCFNDLYKWTMMPVILKLENHFQTTCQNPEKANPIIVTFGIDLRDQIMVDTIMASKDLQKKIFDNLKELSNRKFNYDVFKFVKSKKPTLDYIDNNPSSLFGEKLASNVYYNGESNFNDEEITQDVLLKWRNFEGYDKSNVHIHMFKKSIENKLELFIEATGPWHKVTWLETSIMQCVYETVLRYELTKNKVPYMVWLGDALYRTAKSIAYINSGENTLVGALFTGRRTGGLLFLVLQNYMYSLYQTEPKGPMKLPSLGTSSCDSLYILKNTDDVEEGKLKPPAGTHAHELSMTISALFPDLDYQIPAATQIIGHYLYWSETMKKKPITEVGPVPALPDTIGTTVFLRASKMIAIKDGNNNEDLFFNKISTFRQDSGEMKDFKKHVTNFGYEGGVMASEIENIESIQKAIKNKYSTFGAGGFYGDSAKAWIPEEITKKIIIPDNSMAVKVRRVLNCSDNYTLLKKEPIAINTNYFKSCDDNFNNLLSNYNSKSNEGLEELSKFPIKTGDKNIENVCEKSTKLAIDKNMSKITYELKIALAQGYQNYSLNSNEYSPNVEYELDINNFSLVEKSQGGKRINHRNKIKTKKRKNKKSFMKKNTNKKYNKK
jgi:nicotinic acid phosphoribosyltransferase